MDVAHILLPLRCPLGDGISAIGNFEAGQMQRFR